MFSDIQRVCEKKDVNKSRDLHIQYTYKTFSAWPKDQRTKIKKLDTTKLGETCLSNKIAENIMFTHNEAEEHS